MKTPLILLPLAALTLIAHAAPETPVPAPTPAASAPGSAATWAHPVLAQLTDAECLALQQYLSDCVRAGFALMADEAEAALARQDMMALGLCLRHAADACVRNVPLDSLPADFRDYLALAYEQQAAFDAEERAFQEELERRGVLVNEENDEFYSRVAAYTARKNQARDALMQQYPRAATVLPGDIARGIFLSLAMDEGPFHRFREQHTELPTETVEERGAVYIAYLRDRATPPLTEPDTAKARRLLITCALYEFRGDFPYAVAEPLRSGNSFRLCLPQDDRTGYGWQLATTIPEDAPCNVACRRLEAAQWEKDPELREQLQRELASLPQGATHLDVLTITPRREGDITLQIVLTHPQDAEPVFTHEIEYSVVIPQGDRPGDDEDNDDNETETN